MDEQRIRIFAIDDDRIFLKLLESTIREVEDELDIKASMTFCTQPPADLNVMEYNLFFVDIEMSCINGFMLAEQIMKTADARIVFVTAENDHVFESFQYHAYDFVRKSELKNDLRRVVQRYISECLEMVSFCCSGIQFEVSMDGILMIAINGNYLHLYADGNKYKIRMTLKKFVSENRISEQSRFVQINQSEVINMDRIVSVDHNSLHLETGLTVYVSRSRLKEFMRKYRLHEMRK